ncbi:uncharacterized protein [Cicer arietinum]|uniref:Uncharacterized protein LOC101489793 n=1 Tax=Cicer arietinum TaxID=3827 RepID=A0A1S2YV40_CICAR|nr:uncharacterized protein LOC101489793 [Cicer arietinum]
MEFRSKSCRDESLQIESYTDGRVAPTSMQDLRCYSTNYAYEVSNKEMKIEKGERTFGKTSKNWSFINDPELQRKKRVAGYKVYDVEGKMKGTFKKSFRWIKNTCRWW